MNDIDRLLNRGRRRRCPPLYHFYVHVVQAPPTGRVILASLFPSLSQTLFLTLDRINLQVHAMLCSLLALLNFIPFATSRPLISSVPPDNVDLVVNQLNNNLRLFGSFSPVGYNYETTGKVVQVGTGKALYYCSQS